MKESNPYQEAVMALQWIANTPAQAHEYRGYAQETLRSINVATKKDVLVTLFMEAIEWGSGTNGFLTDPSIYRAKAKELYEELIRIYPELK